jgi:hypothetical protein
MIRRKVYFLFNRKIVAAAMPPVVGEEGNGFNALGGAW